MRIALVLPYNPLIERTGLQNLSVRWGRALIEAGHAPSIVTLGPDGSVENVPVIGHSGFLDLLRTLMTGDWDVIHWLEVWPGGLHVAAQHIVSWFCGRVRKSLAVLTTETPGNLTNRGGDPISKRIARRAYGAYVVPSEDFLEEYSRFGIGRDRITIVPHGLMPDEPFQALAPREIAALRRSHGLCPDLPIVLFIGRLVQRKRPLDFIAAVLRLKARGLAFQAVIVGDALRHEDSIDDEVRATLASAGAEFEYRPMSDRPWDYMGLSDVVVVPSERDGQAFVVIEALACGAVPVVSDIPVLRTTLDSEGTGACGLLFPAGDVDALASAIGRLVTDEDFRLSIRANGLLWMKSGRNLETIIGRLVSLYERRSPASPSGRSPR